MGAQSTRRGRVPGPQHSKPCRECPFRRKSMPGYVGMDTPDGFLATTMADHRMPCHLKVDYESETWESDQHAAPECAGAATFFANLCKRSRDPNRMRIPADCVNVFARPEEFLAHHLDPRPSGPAAAKPESGRCFGCSTELGSGDWCPGCKSFICDECSRNLRIPMGGHSPEAHLEDMDGD